MSLIDLIKTHCSADAEAGNWSAVAETLNAQLSLSVIQSHGHLRT